MKIMLSHSNEKLEFKTPAEALELAKNAPVFICDDNTGEPTHALLGLEEYQRVVGDKPR